MQAAIVSDFFSLLFDSADGSSGNAVILYTDITDLLYEYDVTD